MALSVCFESLLRTFLTIFKNMISFWFYVIAIIVVLALLKKGKWVAKFFIVLFIVFGIALVLDLIGISFVCELINTAMKWLS